MEEIRKVSCALWDREEETHSPDSLFSVVWRLVPRFRCVYFCNDPLPISAPGCLFGRHLTALETFYRFLCLCCRGYQQQDAHEFMRYLLDKLHTELAQSRTSEQAKNTIVSDIFGGVLQSDVSYQWPSCGLVGKGSSKAFLLFGKGSL